MEKIVEIIEEIECIAPVNEFKDCLMTQDKTSDTPEKLWFNIDVPVGHGLKDGDRIRITIEKV